MTGKQGTPAFDGIRPYPEERYRHIDLAGLVGFTLKWLLDQRIPTTFENVVVAAFRMFPTKFSLEGFVEYPDAARVNRSLLQLGPKYRNWARGSVQKGFVLTGSGLVKVGEVEKTLSTDAASHGREPSQKKTRPRTMDLERELNAVEESALYGKWKNGQLQAATTLEFLNMLGAYAYTSPRALRDRLLRLQQTAGQLGRGDMVEFLKAVRGTFSDTLNES